MPEVVDARTFEQIPQHWMHEAEYWRDTPFFWMQWWRSHEDWTHDHCRLCWACICDGRDLDPYDKPGPVEGEHYRHAYHAEQPDGTDVWVCRSCFKRVQKEFGWTRVTSRDVRRRSSSISPR